jgi:EAL domain-containing protein (putative c-di-GMP-specific phosphodiesterase class I)
MAIVTVVTPLELDVSAVLDGLHIHLQPIVDVASGAPLAMEALARFGHAPGRPTDEVIAAAHAAGFGYTLEAACLRAAMARRSELPDGVRLAVNVSPDVLHHPMIARGWEDDLDGVVVEVTEHRANRPAALLRQFDRLRRRGAAIAVDDVGTGYAGLLRLATMRPDYVKIDKTVVTNVRRNDAQAAVLEALVAFSHRMGSAVIGEGVESLDDLEALAQFDVDFGQGWAIGGPGPLVQPISRTIIDACQEARGAVLRRTPRAGSAATTQGMHSVVSTLSNATSIAELHSAAAQAADELGVDVIGASVVGVDGVLREITSSGAAIDTSRYVVADYPATQQVLDSGTTVEVHLADPDADSAEKLLLRRTGNASLLMCPLSVDDQIVGVLEFSSRTHRRWTREDVAHGRGLATHLSFALQRIQR